MKKKARTRESAGFFGKEMKPILGKLGELCLDGVEVWEIAG